MDISRFSYSGMKLKSTLHSVLIVPEPYVIVTYHTALQLQSLFLEIFIQVILILMPTARLCWVEEIRSKYFFIV